MNHRVDFYLENATQSEGDLDANLFLTANSIYTSIKRLILSKKNIHNMNKE